VQQALHVLERRACRVLKHCRATQPYVPHCSEDEEALRKRIIELARAYGRYGYRRMTALLQREGWAVNHKRVERLWRQEGLQVPQKQPKRESPCKTPIVLSNWRRLMKGFLNSISKRRRRTGSPSIGSTEHFIT